MPLDPQVQPLLDLLNQLSFSLEGQEPATLRERTAATTMTMDVPVARVEDRPVPTPDGGVSVRVYTPEAALGGDAPALIWIHGGGWVIGSVEQSDTTARLLAD